jgi:hypothetical protein
MSPNAGEGGCGCGASANEYSCAHGAQINFGDLTPYLTYGGKSIIAVDSKKSLVFLCHSYSVDRSVDEKSRPPDDVGRGRESLCM